LRLLRLTSVRVSVRADLCIVYLLFVFIICLVNKHKFVCAAVAAK
jgi:hypothetical protein